jgi:hypothetical protein
MYRSFVPSYLLERVAAADHPRLRNAPQRAQDTLRHDAVLRAAGRRHAAFEVVEQGPQPNRTISDAHGTESLPGTVARREGGPPVGDVAVNEAYDGFGATYALFEQVYGWNSLDNAGAPLNERCISGASTTTHSGTVPGWCSVTVMGRSSPPSPGRSR